MSDIEVWKGWKRVAAPPDFEDGVLRELRARLRPDPDLRKARVFRWAVSGSAAALLLAFAVLNLFVFRGGTPDGAVSGVAAGRFPSEPVRVTEPLNYGREVRSMSDGPTVYLLEQVSDASSSIIRY
jgi:hypothetical protein